MPSNLYLVCVSGLIVLGLEACGMNTISAAPFDGDRAYSLLEEIVALGPRESGTQASAQTRAIIRREIEKNGQTIHEYPFTVSTPVGSKKMVNVAVVVEGTEPGIILLGNHYDTKVFRDFEFLGANDGGSTTAWMIEMARALGPTREGPSIWLCWFDGEEAFAEWSEADSLYGSRAMVERLKSDGLLEQLIAVINVDMIGDCSLGVIKDADAPSELIDLVWDTARKLGHKKQFTPRVQTVEDDHLPFRRAGVPAINLIDFTYGSTRAEHEMNWHTPRDTVDRVCPESLQVVGDVIYHVLNDTSAWDI